MKTARTIFFCTLSFLLVAAADPFVGTWKVNVDRSKFTPGAPAFMHGTILVESAGNGLKSTSATSDGQGISTDLTFNCQLDGTPCKVTPSLPMRSESIADTITLKMLDPNTMVATGTKNGKPVYFDRRVVSADGKTMTVVRDGTTPQGKRYKSTIFLERVR